MTDDSSDHTSNSAEVRVVILKLLYTQKNILILTTNNMQQLIKGRVRQTGMVKTACTSIIPISDVLLK